MFYQNRLVAAASTKHRQMGVGWGHWHEALPAPLKGIASVSNAQACRWHGVWGNPRRHVPQHPLPSSLRPCMSGASMIPTPFD